MTMLLMAEDRKPTYPGESGSGCSPPKRQRIHQRLDIPDDGFLWHKYGQKHIRGTNIMRNYYRCSMYKEIACPAKRTIDFDKDDPRELYILYPGHHNHKIDSSDVCDSPPASTGPPSLRVENSLSTSPPPQSPTASPDDVLFSRGVGVGVGVGGGGGVGGGVGGGGLGLAGVGGMAGVGGGGGGGGAGGGGEGTGSGVGVGVGVGGRVQETTAVAGSPLDLRITEEFTDLDVEWLDLASPMGWGMKERFISGLNNNGEFESKGGGFTKAMNFVGEMANGGSNNVLNNSSLMGLHGSDLWLGDHHHLEGVVNSLSLPDLDTLSACLQQDPSPPSSVPSPLDSAMAPISSSVLENFASARGAELLGLGQSTASQILSIMGASQHQQHQHQHQQHQQHQLQHQHQQQQQQQHQAMSNLSSHAQAELEMQMMLPFPPRDMSQMLLPGRASKHATTFKRMATAPAGSIRQSSNNNNNMERPQLSAGTFEALRLLASTARQDPLGGGPPPPFVMGWGASESSSGKGRLGGSGVKAAMAASPSQQQQQQSAAQLSQQSRLMRRSFSTDPLSFLGGGDTLRVADFIQQQEAVSQQQAIAALLAGAWTNGEGVPQELSQALALLERHETMGPSWSQ